VRIERREDFLKIGVGVVVGLFLLDRMVLTPAGTRWKAQGERIDALREKVTHGHQLLEREKSIRAKWEEMQNTDLDPEMSTAEDMAFKGITKWATESRISLTSLSPQWRSLDEGYDLLEFRASTTGSQAQLGQFIYSLETDALPVRLDECELTARDAKGQQLTGALRFSFIRLKEGAGK
jgi:hypothetical protein